MPTWEIRILNVKEPVWAGSDEHEAMVMHNSYVANGEFLKAVTLLRDGVVVAEWSMSSAGAFFSGNALSQPGASGTPPWTLQSL